MKVIITDCDHDNIDIEKKILLDVGLDVELKNVINEEDVIQQCQDAEIFIVQYAKISSYVMDNCPKLKCIVRYGVGVDTIDVEAATERGIQVGNVPDYGMNEVADHAISMSLSFLRKIISTNSFTKQCKWDYTMAIPIHRFSSLTVGVVGLGRIGQNFSKKMKGLGFNIIGHDPFKDDYTDISDIVDMVDFDYLLKKSDFISIHCPLDGNKGLFDINAFKKMKKNSFVVNTARGGIINEDDLKKALEEKEILGACLDCMENEPISIENSLFTFDNVIVSPHIAWYSEESAKELKRKVAEEAVRFSKNVSIKYPINKIDGRLYEHN